MSSPPATDRTELPRIDPHAAWLRYCEGRFVGGRPNARPALLDRLVGLVYSLSVAHGREYHHLRLDLFEEQELVGLLDVLESRGFDRDRLEEQAVQLVQESLGG